MSETVLCFARGPLGFIRNEKRDLLIVRLRMLKLIILTCVNEEVLKTRNNYLSEMPVTTCGSQRQKSKWVTLTTTIIIR